MTAIKTADMSRENWLKERTRGIGGSDVATVLGLNPYKTPLDLWEEKTGKTTGKEAGQAAYWGTVLEDVVAREFSLRTGMKIQKVNFMLSKGEGDWMRGNIDRAIINPDIAGRVSVLKPEKASECGRLLTTDVGLECKTANSFMVDQWGDSQESEIVAGKVVTDHKIPLYYETQIQWYMAVTGIETFYVAVLIGGQDFRMYEVKRDEDVINATKTSGKTTCSKMCRRHPSMSTTSRSSTPKTTATWLRPARKRPSTSVSFETSKARSRNFRNRKKPSQAVSSWRSVSALA